MTGPYSLTFRTATDYTLEVRGVAQLAAHRVWDAGAGGSSPPTPTKYLLIVIENSNISKICKHTYRSIINW